MKRKASGLKLSRSLILLLAATALMWTAAFAQVAPSAPPPNAPSDRRSSEPGRNSLTEEQAKNRLQRMGYSEVRELKQDERGVWRGKAVFARQQVDVSLDYRGEITRQIRNN